MSVHFLSFLKGFFHGRQTKSGTCNSCWRDGITNHKPHNSHPTVQSLVPYLYIPSKLQSSWKIKPAQRENAWHPRDQMCINHLLYDFSSFAHLMHWPRNAEDSQADPPKCLRRPLAVTMADGASLVSVSTVWPPPEAWTPRLRGICTTSTVPHLSYSYCYMDPQYFIWAVGVPILRENQWVYDVRQSNHWQSRIRNKYQKRYILHVLCTSAKKKWPCGFGLSVFCKDLQKCIFLSCLLDPTKGSAPC